MKEEPASAVNVAGKLMSRIVARCRAGGGVLPSELWQSSARSHKLLHTGRIENPLRPRVVPSHDLHPLNPSVPHTNPSPHPAPHPAYVGLFTPPRSNVLTFFSGRHPLSRCIICCSKYCSASITAPCDAASCAACRRISPRSSAWIDAWCCCAHSPP